MTDTILEQKNKGILNLMACICLSCAILVGALISLRDLGMPMLVIYPFFLFALLRKDKENSINFILKTKIFLWGFLFVLILQICSILSFIGIASSVHFYPSYLLLCGLILSILFGTFLILSRERFNSGQKLITTLNLFLFLLCLFLSLFQWELDDHFGAFWVMWDKMVGSFYFGDFLFVNPEYLPYVLTCSLLFFMPSIVLAPCKNQIQKSPFGLMIVWLFYSILIWLLYSALFQLLMSIIAMSERR